MEQVLAGEPAPWLVGAEVVPAGQGDVDLALSQQPDGFGAGGLLDLDLQVGS
ncbi:hypothetical protein BJ964_006599 [Actinoplanes lobatus]|uniref:Uncharacterized protein n=1 Tax=Actinoplanes lobatus TaxID=113568 RepID=A0A7W7HKW9_9ACTN|nr:hypothetical protein [Actinoplanes lobatus]